MQLLTLDPPVPFALAPGPLTILLAGCGGTGSHIAQALARLAAHCQATGTADIELVFVDGDTVEQKNVGRQLFCAAEVGQNKARTLAARFGAAFGLRIMALPEMLDRATGLPVPASGRIGILVGAVDSVTGRVALNAALGSRRWQLWLDSGNHERSGQIVLGSVTSEAALGGAFRLGGICTALPSPILLYPDLIAVADVPVLADCATAMADNVQSLMINQQMAAIAAEYLAQLVMARRVTTFQTVVDLTTLSMRSTPITAAGMAAALGLDVETLRHERKAS